MKKTAAILVAALLTISVSACSPSSVQNEASASASASVAASKAAEARKTREAEEKARKEAAEKLDTAKSTLNDKVSQARALLDSSNDNVADPQTRVALSDAINADTSLESMDPEAYTQAIQPLQSAMDGVNASVDRKKQNDTAAAQAAADAAAKAKADADAAAWQAQQQAQTQSQQAQPQTQSQGTAHGGAFCSSEGAQAQSDRSSNILTCRVAADGRLRWKL
ncbi:hypothetical protein [Bifidobacterium tibiigranuli]|uniref:Uncharacterized protein n=1 Tax=Bifidobacterium tibiigranuli TaxID=2172043 RepID=A0A5N6RY21_9BIFI|nr:hypothetical protein [Bifidobacterium tibiigranuli]KAE8127328.1 hypothetical protein DDF78_08885 [Bifidobacterium tibiigranuli]KAE8129719.1 hypothetical protein DDE84_02665 [Bifidobacterium tibiigranuli]